nr:winged helix-turn-helix domain-containing protein [Ohessyouella blattaphilus]
MTRKEFELVRFLVKHENEALSREYIYEQVWWGSFKNADPRTVDGCVKRIRMKIGFHYITSIRGYGYMWNTEGIY